MALELSTIGISLKYAPEGTVGGGKPTSGFTEVANITSIGELSSSPDQLEVTNLQDSWKRYIAGVKDSGSSISIGANFTAAFKTAWATIVSAYATAFEADKNFYWEVCVPDLGGAGTSSSFYFTGEPIDMGLPGIEVNQVFAGDVEIIPNQIIGWADSST